MSARRTNACLCRAPVPHRHFEALLKQVPRHGCAHDAQAQESDLHCFQIVTHPKPDNAKATKIQKLALLCSSEILNPNNNYLGPTKHAQTGTKWKKGEVGDEGFQLWNWNSLKSTGNDGEVVSETRLELVSEPPDGNDFFHFRSISSSVLSILRCHGRKLITFVTTVTALALVTPSERYLPHSSRS